MMFHRNSGLPVMVIRPANAYAEDQRAGTGKGFIATAVAAILAGREIEIYGSEGTVRDYILVSDVAAGIVAALDCGSDGEIYNLGTGVGTSNAGVVKILAGLAQVRGMVVRTKILPPAFRCGGEYSRQRKITGKLRMEARRLPRRRPGLGLGSQDCAS